MVILGVLDLKGGVAVHARGGRRERYAPVQRFGDRPIGGDPLALAEAFGGCGVAELYAADLDAITRQQGPHEALAGIARQAPLWLDTGIDSLDAAHKAAGAGAARLVVGLETLPSFDVLAAICDRWGGERVAFSLDLRDGAPIGPLAEGATPAALAARAAGAGARAVVVLDLARVGAASGVDLELLARVRQAAPDVRLLAGGGVRGLEDLVALGAGGCDGALVASALYDGRLTADDIAAARRLQRTGGPPPAQA